MFGVFQEWTIYQILTFILLVITSLITISLGSKRLYNWHKQRKEKKEYARLMEDPFEVHFLIPTLEDHQITYEKQDTEIHLKDELEIPEGVEDVIFLRIEPRINVKLSDAYFGFKIKETRKKPKLFYIKPFVKEASFQRDWYRDWYGHLHFVGERFRFKDEKYVSSLKIKTYDKGDYTFYVYFSVSCNEYKSVKEEKHTHVEKRLKIRVLAQKKD